MLFLPFHPVIPLSASLCFLAFHTVQSSMLPRQSFRLFQASLPSPTLVPLLHPPVTAAALSSHPAPHRAEDSQDTVLGWRCF